MTKIHKLIVWCILVGLTSFWMWAGVQTWLAGSLFKFGTPNNLYILSALFVILLSLLSVGLIIFQNKAWAVYFGLIVGLTYSLLFRISNINLVGLFILVLLFYHAQDAVEDEMKERIKLNSRILLKKGLINFVTALFVLTSFAAYQSPAIEDFKNIEQLPSSTQVFIRTIVEQTIRPRVQEGTPEQQDYVVNQVTQETIREANLFLKPYFQYVPPGLAFGLFLVLWGVGWVFSWLAVFVGMFLFWILKKTKFFKIEEYDAKAQRLVI